MTEKAKEMQREYSRKWRESHREHLREYRKKWNAANKDKVKQYTTRYWEKKAKTSSDK